MNLFDMARRADKNLVTSDNARFAKQSFEDDVWRGAWIEPAAVPQIRILRATDWFPINERPDACGWYAASRRAKLGGHDGTISLWFEDSARAGQIIGQKRRLLLNRDLKPLTLPWPFDGRRMPEACDLVVHVPPESQDVFLAVHRVLDRADLVRLASGEGVEIGPGPKPQILPGPHVAVNYIEQMSPEEWNRLYNQSGKYAVDPTLWQHYRIGEAHDFPAADESLDFIFSSHVFEHLANPLGHLSYWKSKLKPGGLVLAVVPDIAGTKDYVFKPTPLDELLEERRRGLIEPTLAHYERWARFRAPGQDPAEYQRQRRSIHVHFYTQRNIAEVLQYAVGKLGFSWFQLRHTPNHKDFHFVLAK